MWTRQRLPGLNYVTLGDDDDYFPPAKIMSFNRRILSIPESAKLGNCRHIDEFEKICVIANGEFGTVYKVRHIASNGIYALKKLKVRKDESGQLGEFFPQEYLRMIANMKRVRHINVLDLKEVVVGSKFENNFLLMDYCRYNLEDCIRDVSPVFFQHQHIKNIMLQMLGGLQYIHIYNIVHRNLCPKNILFTENGILKIADMGSSRTESDVDMTPALGINRYRAPEIIFGSRKYTKAVDIWAVGCIFCEMILRKPLICADTDGDVVRRMIELLGSPSERHWPGFSKLPVPRYYHLRRQPYNQIRFVFYNQTIATVNYLQKFLKYNPAIRASIEEVLEDPYYAEYPRRCPDEAIIFMLKVSEKI